MDDVKKLTTGNLWDAFFGNQPIGDGVVSVEVWGISDFIAHLETDNSHRTSVIMDGLGNAWDRCHSDEVEDRLMCLTCDYTFSEDVGPVAIVLLSPKIDNISAISLHLICANCGKDGIDGLRNNINTALGKYFFDNVRMVHVSGGYGNA